MRVLSGTQPSGDYLHIGNYFGAIQQYLAFQEEEEALYFIADYHSMTSVRDAKLRREYTRSVAIDYLAFGLDPQKALLFRQSDVPEVTELAWILSTVCPMGSPSLTTGSNTSTLSWCLSTHFFSSRS